MGIFSSIFGGGTTSASKAGQKATLEDNRRRQNFIRNILGQGIKRTTRLFNQAGQPRREGFQGALDVIGAGVPEQLGLFQAGNVAAQGVTAGGLDPFMAAILGQPLDFRAFQPQQLEADTSFLQGLDVPRFRAPPPEAATGSLDQIGGSAQEPGLPPELLNLLAQIGAGGPQVSGPRLDAPRNF